jgi:tight adherence protein B
MGSGFLLLLGFLTAALAILGIYSFVADLVLSDRSRLRKRVDQEFGQRQDVRKSALFKKLVPSVDTLSDTDQDQTASLTGGFTAVIEQSGLTVTIQQILLLCVAFAGIFGSVVTLLFHIMPGVIVGAVAGALPILFVYWKRKARLEKMMSQLPDAFDLMARVIRAGQTMSQALQAVADEFDAPVGTEFALCFEQQNLGLPPEMAMRELARRTGLLELKIFVLAILVQQQTGGNLAELLDRLATLIRERFRIRGKIRTLTAEGRMQALVLLALPPVLFLAVLLLNRSYGQILLDHPSLLVGMLISELFGALWIRKIIHFDF